MEKSLRKHNSEAKEIIAKEMILDQQLSRKKVLADINQGNYAKEIRTGNSLDAKTVVDTSLKSSCLANGGKVYHNLKRVKNSFFPNKKIKTC